jgi:poly-gamma-glutamate synthesis protein (capsule biosynthesis protein)
MDRTRRFVVAAVYIAAVSAVLGASALLASHLLVIHTAGVVAAATAHTAPFLARLPNAPPRSISLFVAGDVMLDRTVADRIIQSKNDQYPFLKILTDARFTIPDLRLVNLEGPVTSKRAEPEKTIDFQFDPRFVQVLNQVGIDAVSQANNHSLDQGRAGVEESRRLLSAAGLLVFGDEVQDDEIALASTEVRGHTLAIVGFNETSDKMNETQAAATMKKARESAETVVVFMHWGEEYKDRPTASQEARARWLIDHGADIVIGAHPHWVQGISLYKGRPIIYSLGNLVFDQDWSDKTRQGLALGVKLEDAGITINLYPLQIDSSQPRFVEGDVRDARLRDLASISEVSLMPQILKGVLSFPAP